METTKATKIFSRVCKVSAGGLPEGYEAKVNVEFDFDGVDSATERSWAVSHLVISVQRVLRTKKTTELNELVKTGYKVRAIDAGKTVADPTQAFYARFTAMNEKERLEEIARLEEITKKINK